MDKWIGKTAILTGASAGIGKAILENLVKAGVNVVGLARRVERVEALAKDLERFPGKVFACKCDVSDEQSVKSAFKWIEENVGVVHMLINNAGVVR
jgi:NADP+-dependent farnesol dehydrogenase